MGLSFGFVAVASGCFCFFLAWVIGMDVSITVIEKESYSMVISTKGIKNQHKYRVWICEDWMNAFMCVVKDLGNVERRYSGVNKSPDEIPAP